ncbi:hypothetical protein [Planctomyces sp. SH-PL14]|uniref:hypothetical protein n=1 Tax=Planctomyces sp. SH-PL14 TaxID=1632864 RepID=UPI000946627A|nr:hypothetical protein [Planctomyces sp. SH-PL14]
MAIVAATGYLVVHLIPLLSPPAPPQTPRPPAPQQSPSDPALLTDLLGGYWTTDDSRFGLSGQRADAELLARRWRSDGPEPLPESSPLDQELARLLASGGNATGAMNMTFYERSLGNIRIRGVFSSDSPPRLRLFQIALRDGAGWALGEIVPSPEARRDRKPESLITDIKGTRLLRRWSSDERLSGEMVIATTPEAEFVRGLQENGWTVDRAESRGPLTAWQVQRGPAQRLVMSLSETPVPELSTLASAAERSVPSSSSPPSAESSPAASGPSAESASSQTPPSRLLIILKTDSVQELP